MAAAVYRPPVGALAFAAVVTRRCGLGAALGLGAGVLSGLFGVGGGIVIVPGLVLLLRVQQHVAHATSLAAILLIAPAALVGFIGEGAVEYVAAALLTAGSVVGAWAGAALLHRLSADRLRQIFAVFLLVLAVRLALPAGAAVSGESHLDALAVAGLFALGLLAGALSALLGVGGGIVMVPALVLLFGFGQHLAEGTSLLVIVPTALVGAARHGGRGYTNWRLGLLIGLCGVAGGLVGAQTALAFSPRTLQVLFAVFVAVTGAWMLVAGRGQRAAATSAAPTASGVPPAPSAPGPGTRSRE